MKNFILRKIILLTTLFTLVFVFYGVNTNKVLADDKCSAADIVDYLAKKTNLGELPDNSFEGKKAALNKFGIEGLDYLSSPDEEVKVEELASVCKAILDRKGEDSRLNYTDDKLDFIVKIDNGEVVYEKGKWDDYLHSELDKEFKIRVNGMQITIKYGRINDLEEADTRHKLDLVVVFNKGIIIGESLGKYSQKRSLTPKRAVGLSEAREAIERAYDIDKRYPMSPDGQLLRTTKLPVNASEFKYILDAFPNSFYETRFRYEMSAGTYKDEGSDYDRPVSIYNSEISGTNHDYELYGIAEKIKLLQDHRFNVDYRTIDKKWVDEMVECYRGRRDTDKDMKETRKDLKKYVKFVKKNKIVLEAEPASTDVSAAYKDVYGQAFHDHVKFKIVSCKNLKKNLRKLIYGATISIEPYRISRNYKEKIKLGKWIEGVYCIYYPLKYTDGTTDIFNAWAGVRCDSLDLTKRNIKKKRILKQFKITPKNKLWYEPEEDYVFYGWE